MNDFEQAARTTRSNIAGELLHFVKQSKKWWLVPILVTFALFAVLMLLSSTAVAPFIYTLF